MIWEILLIVACATLVVSVTVCAVVRRRSGKGCCDCEHCAHCSECTSHTKND